MRVVLLLGLFTLAARDRMLFLWLLGLLCAWGLGWFLLDRILRGLAVRSALSSAEAFVGDTVSVHLRVTNGSPFPVPWVRFDETVPARLERHRPRWLASLPPRGSHEVQFDLPLPRRGLYRIGRVGFEVGDWFGLWRRAGYVDVPLWLTVFPRPLDVHLPPPPPRLPEGERVRPASPFRGWEPTGLREYRRGDPPRWIAWKATARRGELVVREFPPVRDRALLIVLDLRPSVWPAAHRAAWLERAMSLAATWTAGGAEHDEPVGLYTFGRPARYEPSDAPLGGHRVPAGAVAPASPAVRALTAAPLPDRPVAFELAPRRGSVHRRPLLRALAILEPDEHPRFTTEALAAMRRLSPRSSLLWISGSATGETLAAATTAARAGHAVALAAPEPFGGGPAPGVHIWPIPPGEGTAWDD